MGAVDQDEAGAFVVTYASLDDSDEPSLTCNYRWPDGSIQTGTFTPVQIRLPALLIPVWWNRRVVGHRLRPDNPRLARRNDKERPVKYEQPSGLSTHLDANPLAWPYLIDPSYPLFITEGESVGLALGTWNQILRPAIHAGARYVEPDPPSRHTCRRPFGCRRGVDGLTSLRRPPHCHSRGERA